VSDVVSLYVLHAGALPAFQIAAHQSALLFFNVLLFLLEVGNLKFLIFDVPAVEMLQANICYAR
jgi:hypothetical protein